MKDNSPTIKKVLEIHLFCLEMEEENGKKIYYNVMIIKTRLATDIDFISKVVTWEDTPQNNPKSLCEYACKLLNSDITLKEEGKILKAKIFCYNSTVYNMLKEKAEKPYQLDQGLYDVFTKNVEICKRNANIKNNGKGGTNDSFHICSVIFLNSLYFDAFMFRVECNLCSFEKEEDSASIKKYIKHLLSTTAKESTENGVIRVCSSVSYCTSDNNNHKYHNKNNIPQKYATSCLIQVNKTRGMLCSFVDRNEEKTRDINSMEKQSIINALEILNKMFDTNGNKIIIYSKNDGAIKKIESLQKEAKKNKERGETKKGEKINEKKERNKILEHLDDYEIQEVSGIEEQKTQESITKLIDLAKADAKDFLIKNK